MHSGAQGDVQGVILATLGLGEQLFSNPSSPTWPSAILSSALVQISANKQAPHSPWGPRVKGLPAISDIPPLMRNAHKSAPLSKGAPQMVRMGRDGNPVVTQLSPCSCGRQGLDQQLSYRSPTALVDARPRASPNR